MSPEQENFEQIRRVLALKRHEIPPPGYFHHFSREVIVRIKAGDLGEARVIHESWFKRFWTMLDTKPVWAGAVGAAVCGFFVVGAVVSSESGDNSGLALGEAPAMPVSLANQQVSSTWQQTQPAASVMPVESLNAQTPRNSLFDEYNRLRNAGGVGVFNANFVPAGN